jgi:hypothetical protein
LPWNGSGTFSRVYSWVADAAAGIDISSSRTDTDSNDIVTNGLNNALTRDGQGVPTTNLPMNGFRHTGAGDGVAATDYATLEQLEIGKVPWAIATGTADAIAATYSPTFTLADGQLFWVRALLPNATATPTFSPNGNTARVITKVGGVGLFAGDIPRVNAETLLRYNSANTRYELLNPALGRATSVRVANDFQVTSSGVLVNVTGLSVLVRNGRTYTFEAYLTCTDAAAGGVQAAIAGTTTASNIIYDGWLMDNSTIKAQTNSTALATAVASTTTTNTAGLVIIIKGTITTSANGTLTVQFAQNTSNVTASTVKQGSTFVVADVT